MTKEEFEEYYIKSSGITKDFYDEHFKTEPCECDYIQCKGWIAANKQKPLK